MDNELFGIHVALHHAKPVSFGILAVGEVTNPTSCSLPVSQSAQLYPWYFSSVVDFALDFRTDWNTGETLETKCKRFSVRQR